jgi:hypothetical protein
MSVIWSDSAALRGTRPQPTSIVCVVRIHDRCKKAPTRQPLEGCGFSYSRVTRPTSVSSPDRPVGMPRAAALPAHLKANAHTYRKVTAVRLNVAAFPSGAHDRSLLRLPGPRRWPDDDRDPARHPRRRLGRLANLRGVLPGGFGDLMPLPVYDKDRFDRWAAELAADVRRSGGWPNAPDASPASSASDRVATRSSPDSASSTRSRSIRRTGGPASAAPSWSWRSRSSPERVMGGRSCGPSPATSEGAGYEAHGWRRDEAWATAVVAREAARVASRVSSGVNSRFPTGLGSSARASRASRSTKPLIHMVMAETPPHRRGTANAQGLALSRRDHGCGRWRSWRRTPQLPVRLASDLAAGQPGHTPSYELTRRWVSGHMCGRIVRDATGNSGC